MIDEIRCEIGVLAIAASDGRLCGLDFDGVGDRMRAQLARRYGSVDLRGHADPFGLSGRILAYLGGDLDVLGAMPVETGGTAFQRRVWEALRRIPAGVTVTYADLAREVGRTAAPRAVGAANGRNPVPIVIPCHRVIGADGSLTGYAGGLWRKRWLLSHEGVRPPGPRAVDARGA